MQQREDQRIVFEPWSMKDASGNHNPDEIDAGSDVAVFCGGNKNGRWEKDGRTL